MKDDSVVTTPFEVALSLSVAMLVISLSAVAMVGGWLLLARLFGL